MRSLDEKNSFVLLNEDKFVYLVRSGVCCTDEIGRFPRRRRADGEVPRFTKISKQNSNNKLSIKASYSMLVSNDSFLHLTKLDFP